MSNNSGFIKSIVTPSPLKSVIFPTSSLTLRLYDTIPSLCNTELTSNEAVQLLSLVLLISIVSLCIGEPEMSNVMVGGSWIGSFDVNANVIVF